MSTTDDTSTPDATALDPAMLDEVEQALDAVRTGGGVAHPNGGIPQAETTKPGDLADFDDITTQDDLAVLDGGIPQPESPKPDAPQAETLHPGGIAPLTGGIPQPETPKPGGFAPLTGGIPQPEPHGGVARPNGGIPQAETVRP